MASSAFAVGAGVPFTTLEAEDGLCGGGAEVHSLVVASVPATTSSPELEASNRAFVRLAATGDSVSFTNPVASATGINIRFSIPDGTNGGGTTATLNLYVDGVFRQAVTLSSRQAWLYEASVTQPTGSDTPGSGLYPYLFWDETHVKIAGAAVAANSVITLQKDSANASPYYDVDCVDVEAIPAALNQPTNSLSILNYNAVGDGVTDCTVPIRNCISAAASSGMSVWIPPGRYLVTGQITATNVAISGAGMWYTTLYRAPAGTNRTDFVLTGGSLQNLNIDTNSTVRGYGAAGDYGVVISGDDWLVNKVWFQHTQAAVWASGTGGTVQYCRIANTFADGINLNNASGVGNNLTATNNFIRGTGDDGIAINATTTTNTGTAAQMQSPTVMHNTVVAPWWADCLRIAGGTNVAVAANLLCDSVTTRGLVAGVYGANGYGIDSGLVNNNTVLRCGGGANPYGVLIAGGATSQTVTITFEANIVEDSLYAGVAVGSSTLTFGPHNDIIDPGTTGIEILANSTGTGTFSGNVMSGVPAGQYAFYNYSPTTYSATVTGNSGF